MMRELAKILAEYPTETILEIGPGWGNYTIELSRLCKEITCLDLSDDVLQYIQNIAEEQRCNNVKCICTSWEKTTQHKQYDIVFGYNCYYRIKDLQDCFTKMNQSAKKLCVAGMGMGMMPPYYIEMKEVLGIPLIYGKKDMIYFINILYSMGIDANMKVIPLHRTFHYDTWNDVVKGETSRLSADSTIVKDHLPQIKPILKSHFKPDCSGTWRYEYHYRGALIFWEPV